MYVDGISRLLENLVSIKIAEKKKVWQNYSFGNLWYQALT